MSRTRLRARLEALEAALGADTGGCCLHTPERLHSWFDLWAAPRPADQPAPRFLEGATCTRTGGPPCAEITELCELFAARLEKIAATTEGLFEHQLHDPDDLDEPAPIRDL